MKAEIDSSSSPASACVVYLKHFVLVSVECVIGKEKKDRGRVGQLNCESDESDRGNRRGVGMDI